MAGPADGFVSVESDPTTEMPPAVRRRIKSVLTLSKPTLI